MQSRIEPVETPKISYSVVIPVYNSSTSVTELVDSIAEVFSTIVNETYEIILVDDCSPNPQSWSTIARLTQENKCVIGVQLMRNFGKPGAIICGFSHCSGEYVFTLDDDLQHDPRDIPKFLLKKDHDVVMAAYSAKKHGRLKRITSSIKGWFDHKLLGKPRNIQVTPYKLYKSIVVKSMLKVRTPYPFIPALLFNTTRDIVTVDIPHLDRRYGTSEFSIMKRIRVFSHLLINNSAFLLRSVAIFGILISLVSFVLSIYFILKNLVMGIPVPGWTSLMVITLCLNGLLLFSIGIIGEYLIRIINGIDKRPSYIERRVIVNQQFYEPDTGQIESENLR